MRTTTKLLGAVAIGAVVANTAAYKAAGHTSLCSAAPTKADNNATALTITVA